jgi:hypothetical protein
MFILYENTCFGRIRLLRFRLKLGELKCVGILDERFSAGNFYSVNFSFVKLMSVSGMFEILCPFELLRAGLRQKKNCHAGAGHPGSI